MVMCLRELWHIFALQRTMGQFYNRKGGVVDKIKKCSLNTHTTEHIIYRSVIYIYSDLKEN